MRCLMILGPTLEVGYRIDSDICQMTDDGRPPVPAQLPDQHEGHDHFSVPPQLEKSRWQRLNDKIELMGRWRAACKQLVK